MSEMSSPEDWCHIVGEAGRAALGDGAGEPVCAL